MVTVCTDSYRINFGIQKDLQPPSSSWPTHHDHPRPPRRRSTVDTRSDTRARHLYPCNTPFNIFIRRFLPLAIYLYKIYSYILTWAVQKKKKKIATRVLQWLDIAVILNPHAKWYFYRLLHLFLCHRSFTPSSLRTRNMTTEIRQKNYAKFVFFTVT